MEQIKDIEGGNEAHPDEVAFIQKLRELAANAPKRMEETQKTTDTEWVRAYMDRVTVISGTAQMFFMEHEELKPKYKLLLTRVDELIKNARQANETYGPIDPPPEVKKELMKSLNVFD